MKERCGLEEHGQRPREERKRDAFEKLIGARMAGAQIRKMSLERMTKAWPCRTLYPGLVVVLSIFGSH